LHGGIGHEMTVKRDQSLQSLTGVLQTFSDLKNDYFSQDPPAQSIMICTSTPNMIHYHDDEKK